MKRIDRQLNASERNSAINRFAALLSRHLADGCRPSGSSGEPWTYAAFANETASSRANQFVSPRTVSNWCQGRSLPVEIEPVLAVLFGRPTNRIHLERRDELLDAFRHAWLVKHGNAVFAGAQASPEGATWIIEGTDRFDIDRESLPDDARMASEPLQQQLQSAIRLRAQELAEVSKRLANSMTWGALPSSAEQLHTLIQGGPSTIPDKLGELYACTLRLGRFLETDIRVQGDAAAWDEPLDPDIHGLLTDVVRTVAPWLRRFPTVVAWDDASGKMLNRIDLIPAAREFTRVARDQEIITERAASEVMTLLEAANNDSFIGQKSGNRAAATAKNLLLVAAGISAAALTQVSPISRSLFTKRVGEALSIAEKAIETFAITLPDDLRHALRALVRSRRRSTEAVPDDVEERAKRLILEGVVIPKQWCEHVRDLDLGRTNISRLDFLQDLTNIRRLNLRNTQVQDISPLSRCVNLQSLDLSGTNVSDISPLSKLIELSILRLNETLVEDISALRELPKLEYLGLRGSLVKGTSPVRNLPFLVIDTVEEAQRTYDQRFADRDT